SVVRGAIRSDLQGIIPGGDLGRAFFRLRGVTTFQNGQRPGTIVGTVAIPDHTGLFGLFGSFVGCSLFPFSSLFGIGLCFGLGSSFLLCLLGLVLGGDWLVCRTGSDGSVRVQGFSQPGQTRLLAPWRGSLILWLFSRAGGDRSGHRRGLWRTAINVGLL